jgi:hypothetical protein
LLSVNGEVWVGTGNGMISGQTRTAFSVKDPISKNISLADGLCNFEDSDGIWGGTWEGIMAI